MTCTLQIIKYVSLKKEKEINHRDNTKTTAAKALSSLIQSGHPHSAT